MTDTTALPDAPRLVLSELADALFEAVPHGLVVTDRNGVIRWADRWFGELAAKNPDEVRGLRLSRCVTGAGPVLRSLRRGDRAEGPVRLKRKGRPDLELHAQAAKAGPRASGTVVWVLDDNAASPAIPTPGSATTAPRPAPATRPRNQPLPASEAHLEALRLLHELSTIDEP